MSQKGKANPRPGRELRNQAFLGNEKFVDEVRRRLPPDKDLSEIPQSLKRPAARPLAYYSDKMRDRDEAIFKAYQSRGYSMKQIGDYFDLHYSRISRIMWSKEQEVKDKT